MLLDPLCANFYICYLGVEVPSKPITQTKPLPLSRFVNGVILLLFDSKQLYNLKPKPNKPSVLKKIWRSLSYLVVNSKQNNGDS